MGKGGCPSSALALEAGAAHPHLHCTSYPCLPDASRLPGKADCALLQSSRRVCGGSHHSRALSAFPGCWRGHLSHVLVIIHRKYLGLGARCLSCLLLCNRDMTAADLHQGAALVRPAPQYQDVGSYHMIFTMPAVQLHVPFPHRSPRKAPNTSCTVCPFCQGFALCLAQETAMLIRVAPDLLIDHV